KRVTRFMPQNRTENLAAPPESRPAHAAGNGAPRPSSFAFEVRDLCRYFGRLKAVEQASFSARPGEVVGFIGPNGAGKTTTMRILATLDLPTSGDAFVAGYSVIDDPDK